MGIRSPQQMQTVQTRAEGSGRASYTPPPQVGKEFLGTIDNIIDNREKARRVQEEEGYKLVRDMASVEVEKERLEAQAKLAGTNGLDAVQEADKLRQDLTKGVDRVASTVPAQYRDRLKRELLPDQLSKYNRNAIPFQYGQVVKLKDEVQKTRISQMRDEVVENSSDVEGMSEGSLARLKQKVFEYGQAKFGNQEITEEGLSSKDAIQGYVQRISSDAIAASAIHQAGTLGSIDRAKNILTKFEAEMLPADRAKVVKAIERAEGNANNGIAMQLAETAMTEFGDDIAAIERSITASSGNSTTIRSNAMAIVNSHIAAKEKTRKLRRDKTKAQAYVAIERGAPLNDKILESLDPEDYEAVKKYAVDKSLGKDIATDQQVYTQTMSKVVQDPDALINGEVNLQALKGSLNREDYKTFERIQTQLVKEQKGESRRVANRGIRLAQDVVTRYKNEKGLSINVKKGAALERYASDYVMDLIETNPNISEKEIRNKLQQSLYDRGLQVTEEPKWFGLSSETVQTPAPIPVRVKAEIRSKIEAIIKKKGEPLTEATIKLYADELQKQKYDVYE